MVLSQMPRGRGVGRPSSGRGRGAARAQRSRNQEGPPTVDVNETASPNRPVPSGTTVDDVQADTGGLRRSSRTMRATRRIDPCMWH